MHAFISKTSVKLSALLGCFVLLFAACDDVFEENISDQSVLLITPQNGAALDNFEVHFVWQEVEDALEYRLQVVEPAFSQVSTFVLDSTIATNEFRFQLSPATYEWRVKALNGSSETEWFTWQFTVDSVPSLGGQTLILQSPADGLWSNELEHDLTWEALAAADDYELELTDENNNLITNPIIIADAPYTYTFNEGNYYWAVRARNATSNTLFSVRALSIDTTTPLPPTLVAPADNSTLNDTLQTYSWTRPSTGEVNPSTITDSIFFHTSTTAGATFGYDVSNTSVMDSIGPGTWFWRVSSSDAAGNWSGYSNWRTVILQ